MPFSDFKKDLQGVRVAPRRSVRYWLRELFIVDWSLKLMALVISLGLWYAVTGQRTAKTIPMRGVQLSFRLPTDLEIVNEPRHEVEVTLTGSKRALDQIKKNDLIIYVDIANTTPGDRIIYLTPNTVTMSLPEGVRVDDIEPDAIPLKLEPRIEREVEVEPKLEGKLPDGLELRGQTVTPNKVRVRGPASHVNALQKASTDPIQLEGRRESFTMPQVAVTVSDTKIDVIDTVVRVQMEIGEERVERSFNGVSVRDNSGAPARPGTASVTLFGERSALDQLNAQNIQLVLDVADDGSITTRLALPPGMEGRVELRSTKPAGFSIIR
ncbi:MAG TPA: CdaR family protein [Pyrinomonadaceae bacterium]|nr:CdaR family protein [Pyrinomonadaceae bacterium]